MPCVQSTTYKTISSPKRVFSLLQTNYSTCSLLQSLPLSLDSLSSRLHTLPQLIQQRNSLLHRNTSVGYRNTVLQSRRSLGRNILSAFVDVGLDHDTDDVVGCGARRKLGGNVGTDLDLVEVLFGGVTVRAVDLFACFSQCTFKSEKMVRKHTIILAGNPLLFNFSAQAATSSTP